MASRGSRIELKLTVEEYERLKSLAAKRDCSVADLIRQAIRRVYMNEVERDLAALEAQRLGETSLLMDEEGGAIGIRGRELPAEEDSLASD